VTLNCNFSLEDSRERFAQLTGDKNADDGRAKDLLEAASEYWQYDMITDAELAADLRRICEYLDKQPAQAGGQRAKLKPGMDL
jgi:hypothetical protein